MPADVFIWGITASYPLSLVNGAVVGAQRRNALRYATGTSFTLGRLFRTQATVWGVRSVSSW